MEPELIRQELTYFRCVCTREAAREETVEVLIPDAMGDAAEILDTQGMVFLRSKESEDGLMRLRGSIEGSVLYRTEEGELCALPFKSECRMEWTGEELKRDARLSASLGATGVEGRIINPRKILVSGELTGKCSQWCAEQTAYANGAAAGSVETRTETQTIRLVSDVTEKTFALTEDFSLGEGAAPIEEILLYRCASQVEEAHSVAGKLILQGSTHLELLYADEEGKAHSFSCNSGWSQLIDSAAEPSCTHIHLMPTALYVDSINAGTAVSLELHLTAQVICSESVEAQVLADAYSTDYEAELQTRELVFTSFADEETGKQESRSSIKPPEDMDELLLCYGEAISRQACGIHVLYRDADGTEKGFFASVPVEREGSFVLRELSAAKNGGSIDLRLSLASDTPVSCETALRWVDGIRLDENSPLSQKNRPGLVAVRRNSGSYWDLARKYGSTVSLIEKANEEIDEKDIFLFIPRAR